MKSAQTTEAKGTEPSPELSEQVRTLVGELGEDGAAEFLGVSRATLARLAGRLRCHRATLKATEIQLRDRNKAKGGSSK